ncbi:MAG: hypothetical protein KatS3mg013_0537 [Actinomycetota bacterium]|jgi:hypothetical protein|nr:MAG: hypothetical protein KatS3mg013_0537 [Actinomycetota bacterium]
MRRSLPVPLLAAALALGACGGRGEVEAEPPIRVVVLQDGRVPDALELVSPVVLSVELALDEGVALGRLPAGSGIRVIDVADPARSVGEAAAAAADPSVVAAVVAPFVDAPWAVEELLGAGVPVVSLSGRGPAPRDGPWRRLVPTDDEVEAGRASLAGPHACSADEVTVLPTIAACTGVLADADADEAIALRTTLDRVGATRVPLVVGPLARVARLARAYPTMVGTLAAGPCRGIDTSAAPAAQRFVHAFQAAHGLPVGPCAAEAYGFGRWLVDRLAAGAAARTDVARALETLTRLPTPAGPITFDAMGEREAPGVAFEEVVGVRWLPVVAG